jgi:hypothetical protein
MKWLQSCFSTGLATTVAMTALFTDSIKNMVGMPRPDFFDRCFPDGIAVRVILTNPVKGRFLMFNSSEKGLKLCSDGKLRAQI